MKLNTGIKQLALAAGCLISASAAFANPTDALSSTETTDLVIATWNMEHLSYPHTDGCRPRSQQEVAELKAYAKSLNADIVALQEIGSAEAAAQIFPEDEWQILMSDRPDSESYTCRKTGFTSTQQKVAFAVRNAVKVVNTESLEAFGLDMRGLRYGMELTVESPMGEMSLLNVHMKSGCFVDNYSRAETEACQIFAQQAPILDAWVEEKEKLNKPYAMLGDFNHRLSAPYNHLTRQLTNNSDGSESSLVNTMANVLGCHPYYPAPIDHIWVGNIPAKESVNQAVVHAFNNMEPDAMLSDHCAITLTLNDGLLPLTNSVTWQTQSKEYRYITTAIYHDAVETLNELPLPKGSWVAVMDVDETVLDNSAYQVNLDNTGGSYSSKTWADWVASEKAVLVPGVKHYIEAVLAKGGKLGLVTNRNRAMDNHTWNNLLAMGLPITTDNTCLMGRHPDDEAAVENGALINDKDLRRQQITNGTASCYAPEATRHNNFGKQTILMQVGDNIEDFDSTTQEDADVSALLSRSKGTLVLLPNPMYGSW